jgi:hypothetical protein
MIPAETTGTIDDQDAPDDERAGENEIPVGETSDATEAPEEFALDERELEDPDDQDDDDEAPA